MLIGVLCTDPSAPSLDESVEDDASVESLWMLRSLLRLDSVSVHELIQMFSDAEDDDGCLTAAMFERCLRSIMIAKGASSEV